MLERVRRNGVTLVELLIALAIVALLAAALYPAVGVQLRRGNTAAIANQINNLRDAISNYQQNVLRWPSALTQLTVQPVAGALDACGNAIPAANRNAWRGPYLAQNIVGDMPVGDATVQNALSRNPPTTGGGQVGLLQINLTAVDSTSWADLEQQFDGNNNPGTGSLTWAPTGAMTFNIPIRGC